MKKIITSLVVLTAMGVFAHAQESTTTSNELNNEKSVTNSQRPQLQGTVVMRINNQTHEMQMLTTSDQIKNQNEAQNLALKGEFKAIPKDKIRSELDKDTATSTWFWRYPRWGGGYRPVYGWGGGYGGFYGGYYPTYYYYGSPYSPCYSWNYGPYSYYYYGYNQW